MSKFKRYIGDGVYVDLERGMVKLTTSDGVRDTNTIFLETSVVDQFLRWLEELRVPKQEE